MTNYKHLIFLFLSAIILPGCDSDPAAKTEKAEAKSFIPEHQMEALKKAQGVEQVILESTKQRNEAVAD